MTKEATGLHPLLSGFHRALALHQFYSIHLLATQTYPEIDEKNNQSNVIKKRKKERKDLGITDLG